MDPREDFKGAYEREVRRSKEKGDVKTEKVSCEAEVGGSLEVRSSRAAWPTG